MRLPLIPASWVPDYYKVSGWASLYSAVVTLLFVLFMGAWWGFDLRGWFDARLGHGPATALYFIVWVPPWVAMMVLQFVMALWSNAKFQRAHKDMEEAAQTLRQSWADRDVFSDEPPWTPEEMLGNMRHKLYPPERRD